MSDKGSEVDEKELSNEAERKGRRRRKLSSEGTAKNIEENVADELREDVSEVKEDVKDIRDFLAKLDGKLDSLAGVKEEISGLVKSVNSILKTVGDMEKRFEQVDSKLVKFEERVVSLEERTEKQKAEMERGVAEVEELWRRNRVLEDKCIDQEARSRRNNVIVFGVSEVEREDCVSLFRSEVLEKCGLRGDIAVERAHRLGRPARGKSRPLIARLLNDSDKQRLMKSRRYLPDHVRVTDDLPHPIREARKDLRPELTRAREENRDAFISFPARLIVDGSLVREIRPRLVQDSRRVERPDSQTAANPADHNAWRGVRQSQQPGGSTPVSGQPRGQHGGGTADSGQRRGQPSGRGQSRGQHGGRGVARGQHGGRGHPRGGRGHVSNQHSGWRGGY